MGDLRNVPSNLDPKLITAGQVKGRDDTEQDATRRAQHVWWLLVASVFVILADYTWIEWTDLTRMKLPQFYTPTSFFLTALERSRMISCLISEPSSSSID